MEKAVSSLLRRAVEMDTAEQYTMALVLYQEGVQILLDSLKEMTDSAMQRHVTTKVKQYLDRAEKIKVLIKTRKIQGTYRESTRIEEGTIGHSYASVFGRFLDASVTYVCIEEPYIRTFHQCQNLVRLCELIVQKCQALSMISVITTRDPADTVNQVSRLEELRISLASRAVEFKVNFSDTLHDRQITMSNGWVVKIGRGLDYFKAPNGKFVLGSCDLDLRPCLETTVDIFHKSSLQTRT